MCTCNGKVYICCGCSFLSPIISWHDFSRRFYFPTGMKNCFVLLFSQYPQSSGLVQVSGCVCIQYVSVILPVLVLFVFLLSEACGTKSLAGQCSLHVLYLPPPQFPDGWTDKAPLVQIHGSIKLHVNTWEYIRSNRLSGNQPYHTDVQPNWIWRHSGEFRIFGYSTWLWIAILGGPLLLTTLKCLKNYH